MKTFIFFPSILSNMSVLKATVLSLDENLLSKKALFDIFTQNYSKIHNAKIDLIQENSYEKLKITFPSSEEFKNTFMRSLPLSEKFLNYFRNSPFREIKFEYKHTLPEKPPSDYIFLTIKLESDEINVVKNSYHFNFEVANFMGIGVAYEEIEDGLIIFYKLKQDFDFIQIDKTDFNAVVDWMKENMVMKEIHRKFIQQFFPRIPDTTKER
jgi:hypothetical protein